MLNVLRTLLERAQRRPVRELRALSSLTTPKLVPFEIGETEAKDRFHKWQSTKWFAPSKLLEAPDVSIRAIYVPFWCFDAQLYFTYSAIPAFKLDSERKLRRGEEIKGSLPPQCFSSSFPEAQIYASYNSRRDFLEAVKVSSWEEKAREMTKYEIRRNRVATGEGVQVTLFDAPTLRQGIAWELAQRAIIKKRKRELEQSILQEYGAAELHELLLTPKVTRLLYVAHDDYGFTRAYTSGGELKENRFQSVIGGTEAGGVLGERHYSPRKMQVAVSVVGGSAGSILALIGDTSSAVATIFYSFLAAITASTYAQFSTIIDRWNQIHSVELDHQEFTKQYFKDFVGDPSGAFSDYQDTLRCESEWSQWEELKKWNWKEEERRNWCETLWREQHRRRRDNINFKIKTEQEKIKRQQELEREERRRRRFGESERQETNHSFPWRKRGGGRKDAFGFYALLGLNPEETVTSDEVKEAFKREAMRCHPDLHAVHLKAPNGGGRMDIAQRRKRFQSLQEAYEVLRDPQKRQRYDRGELRKHDL